MSQRPSRARRTIPALLCRNHNTKGSGSAGARAGFMLYFPDTPTACCQRRCRLVSCRPCKKKCCGSPLRAPDGAAGSLPGGNGRHAWIMAGVVLTKRLNEPAIDGTGGDRLNAMNERCNQCCNQYGAAPGVADGHDFCALSGFVGA